MKGLYHLNVDSFRPAKHLQFIGAPKSQARQRVSAHVHSEAVKVSSDPEVKSAASAFFPGRSVLPERLAERSINTVLITGTVTNECCESSARDASTLGYRVIMVADANASVDDESHNATLHTIYRTFGDVRPTTEVLGLINESTCT